MMDFFPATFFESSAIAKELSHNSVGIPRIMSGPLDLGGVPAGIPLRNS